MKYNTLKTSYFDLLDKSMPWSGYPRPMLVRDSFLCLNGEWDFSVSRENEPPFEYNDKILVPFPPESACSGLQISINKGDILHYRRSFTIPEDFNKGKTILHFGAVDQECEVYLNDCRLGEHKGGYLPFEFDITDLITKGENTLYVKAIDDLDIKYPYGKQTRKRGGMWYTPVSGIWQTVWIESVPDNYIKGLKISTDTEKAVIEVCGGEQNKLLLLDSGERFEFSGDKIIIKPDSIRLWTPETPYLYNFTLVSGKDSIRSYFALREIGTKEIGGIQRLCLNGEPYVFNGLLDQGYYPDGLFLPATEKGYEDDILLAKKLGFNMLRKHIKLEPQIFYHLCDKHGMAVFQDMINNSDYSFVRDTALPTIGIKRLPDKLMHRGNESRALFIECTKGIINELYNFPSVLYYTIFNEGWGQFDADGMYRLVKKLDSTRIIDSTSGWFTRRLSDADSRHVYFKKIKSGRIGTKPVVISEFGGYSYRITGHLFGDANYGYKQFDTPESFEEAFVALYENEVIPLIQNGGCAFVYTQLSDVEDETNGLITYDRKVLKVNEEKIRALMYKVSGKVI